MSFRVSGISPGGTSSPSKSPVTSPTLPPGSTVLLACGSTAGGCRESATNDPTRVAYLNESHEVRCCVESSTNPGGWSKHSSGKCAADGFTSTWGESQLPNGVGCVHSATYDEAEAYCSNAGGRLCTAAELLADCTRGSGCSHDNDYIWSSTPGSTSTESPTKSPSKSPTQGPSLSPVTTPDDEVLTCQSEVTASTIGKESQQMVDCGTTDGTGGGMWYNFFGTGDTITLTTCATETDYETKIRVFSSGTCVVGNDDFCGLQSSVTFDSEVGVEYDVLVQ